MKPVLVSSGEPAGIGPDLCIALADYELPIVVLGDREVLEQRAQQLQKHIDWIDYQANQPIAPKQRQLVIKHIPCHSKVTTGILNPENAEYVINLLTTAATLCQEKQFSALVTAPVHKANINSAQIEFTGHTEFFQNFFSVPQVVMMLACRQMKVALVTTHLPIKDVPNTITIPLIKRVIEQLNQSLIEDFAIDKPRIIVAGLNPHAGESGYLGREEIDIINPALTELKAKGIQIDGPLPADTMFVNGDSCDAYVAMYHDQGLPVLKYAGFHHSVNITLGLPIIRTSVDHGTALNLAGKNQADIGSMCLAVNTALTMAKQRTQYHESKYYSGN